MCVNNTSIKKIIICEKIYALGCQLRRKKLYPKVLTGVISGKYAYGFTERHFNEK